jgi:hypothetical protein
MLKSDGIILAVPLSALPVLEDGERGRGFEVGTTCFITTRQEYGKW